MLRVPQRRDCPLDERFGIAQAAVSSGLSDRDADVEESTAPSLVNDQPSMMGGVVGHSGPRRKLGDSALTSDGLKPPGVPKLLPNE